ncbi:MAG: rhodanese-like domain-containing protein [Armatimonadota bacterium]
METTPHGYKVVTPEEVAETFANDGKTFLLDVRTPGEWVTHRIPGVVLIPIDQLASRYQELDPDRPTIVICEHGVRSEAAADFLARHDFADVATMRGGMAQWPGTIEKG